jgi:hypothetical protein
MCIHVDSRALIEKQHVRLPKHNRFRVENPEQSNVTQLSCKWFFDWTALQVVCGLGVFAQNDCE